MKTIPKYLLLFDGNCVLCNWSVNFILRWERSSEIHFAPLKSEIASHLSGLNIPDDLDSIVFIKDGKIFTYSDAFAEVSRFLKWPVSMMFYTKFLPKTFRDWLYQFIATNRYQWFGRTICKWPLHHKAQNRFHR